jgi:hypothetical protein
MNYLHPAARLVRDQQAALLRKLAAEQALRDAQEACHRTGAAWTADPDSDAAYAAYSRACDAFGDAREELARARNDYEAARVDAAGGALLAPIPTPRSLVTATSLVTRRLLVMPTGSQDSEPETEL